MAAGTSEGSRSRRSALVYLHGYEAKFLGKQKWYSIDVDNLSISPVVNMSLKFHTDGGWAFIDHQDIYWVGGTIDDSKTETDFMGLLQFNTRDPNPQWRTISSFTTPKILRQLNPFVVPIDNNLYVLGGLLFPIEKHGSHVCGEIFNFDTKKWTLLKCDWDFRPDAIFLVEKTKIVFCNLDYGYVWFYNVTTREWVFERHPALASSYFGIPEGLESCNRNSVDILAIELSILPPVVNKSTLYWFTVDHHLFGYDLVKKRWFHSKCLDKRLSRPPYDPMSGDYPEMAGYYPATTFLVNLRNDKFLLIIDDCKIFEFAILRVCKCENHLSVSVERLPTLTTRLEMEPLCAKAMPRR